ncbi:MAG: hypothetical protein J0H46_14770 [Bacteroidetes bacterium]|jgi:hypothetical protein|nr:hypothetical protein [Bacteroidota bacterium]
MSRKVALLMLLGVVFFSCKAARKAEVKNDTVSKEVQVPFKMDTITAKLELAPPEGFNTTVIEIMQVYVVSKEEPAVGLTITDLKGENVLHRLPQYSNSESYSFGGGVYYEVHKGEKALLTINTFDQKPIPSRVIISGFYKK